MNWLARETGPGRLGVITSRAVGSAVARNRARRLLREVWRRHQQTWPAPLDMVLVARPSIQGKHLADVEADFQGLLRRAGLIRTA
jgi:ribonuclease P protein component